VDPAGFSRGLADGINAVALDPALREKFERNGRVASRSTSAGPPSQSGRWICIGPWCRLQVEGYRLCVIVNL